MTDSHTTVENEALEQARAADATDQLAQFRHRFHLPAGKIYLDGNSLGLLSRDAESAINDLCTSWRERGIGGWLDGEMPWFGLAEHLGGLLAPLLGTTGDQCIVTGSTTSNLHQLLATFYRPGPHRGVILIDRTAFPSDAHAVQSHLLSRGLALETHLRTIAPAGRLLTPQGVVQACLPDVQLLLLPAVVYSTGQLLPMRQITQIAREREAMVGWDCSHSVGAMRHELDSIDADFAFGCSYKYLNGGPGAVAWLWLNRRHLARSPGMAGWFGMDKTRQFAMTHDFHPAPGAGRMQVGTPHLLSMAPLLASLRMFAEAGIDALREKSLRLTAFLIARAQARLAEFGVGIATPQAPGERGGHVSLTHAQAYALSAAMREVGVIGDFRQPDMVRLCPAALYNTFEEVHTAIERMRSLLARGLEPVGLARVT